MQVIQASYLQYSKTTGNYHWNCQLLYVVAIKFCKRVGHFLYFAETNFCDFREVVFNWNYNIFVVLIKLDAIDKLNNKWEC